MKMNEIFPKERTLTNSWVPVTEKKEGLGSKNIVYGETAYGADVQFAVYTGFRDSRCTFNGHSLKNVTHYLPNEAVNKLLLPLPPRDEIDEIKKDMNRGR